MSSDGEQDFNEDDEDYTYEEDGEEYECDEESSINGDDETLCLDSGNTRVQGRLSESNERRTSRSSEILKKEIAIPSEGQYIIADCAEIEPVMLNMVHEVASLLDLDTNVSQRLLQAFKWDKERLIDAFFANSEKVKAECGVETYVSSFNSFQKDQNSHFDSVADSPRGKSRRLKRVDSKTTFFFCKICCDDTCEVSDAVSLGCKHLYCRVCYTEYLRIKVNDGQACILAHCPEPKCKQIVTKDIFHALLSKEDSTRYDVYYVKNFVEMSKNMKYCPAPRCDKVAIGSGITTVRCTCSYPFCFRCGEEAHEPSSCQQLADWTLKCMNESETANWILANTRKCPTCTTRIEKNQGCNHMTCSRCKYEFCWICMGDWKEHGQNSGGFYKCNKFDASNVNAEVTEAQKAKAELDRYLHYYQRFHGHDVSLKFANTQREQAERRMIEQQETQKTSWIDVQFLKQAAEQVIDCRRVLKYTYVLGYTLKDGSAEKTLFEHHQEMLEKNTDKLQEYTEKTLELVDRTQVINLTRVTSNFMQSLLSTITGGIVSLDDSILQNIPSMMTAGGGGGSAPNSASKLSPK